MNGQILNPIPEYMMLRTTIIHRSFANPFVIYGNTSDPNVYQSLSVPAVNNFEEKMVVLTPSSEQGSVGRDGSSANEGDRGALRKPDSEPKIDNQIQNHLMETIRRLGLTKEHKAVEMKG